jgi:hypothetical protein
VDKVWESTGLKIQMTMSVGWTKNTMYERGIGHIGYDRSKSFKEFRDQE